MIIKLFIEFPKTRILFLKDYQYNPKNINGKLLQAVSFYGPYIFLSFIIFNTISSKSSNLKDIGLF